MMMFSIATERDKTTVALIDVDLSTGVEMIVESRKLTRSETVVWLGVTLSHMWKSWCGPEQPDRPLPRVKWTHIPHTTHKRERATLAVWG